MAGVILRPRRTVLRLVRSAIPTGGTGGGAVDSVDGQTGAVDLSTTYQPLDADLTAIAALASTGFAERTGAATWALAAIPARDLTSTEVLGLAGIGLTGDNRALLESDLGTSVATYDAGLASLSAVDTAADLLPYTTGAAAWTSTSLSSYARTLLDDTTAAAARATLGLSDHSVAMQYVVLASDYVTSSATLGVVTGLSFTPEASATYVVEVIGAFTAAATSTGLTWSVASSGADGVGAFYGTVRGTAAPGVAAIFSAFDGGGVVAGSSSGGSQQSPFFGVGIVTTDAAPTDIGVYVATEIAASAVTIKAGTILRYRRVR